MSYLELLDKKWMVFALTTTAMLSLVSILLGGGFVAALIAVYKAKPERDSVIVSSAQNAAEILQGLNRALYDELTRERVKVDQLEDELAYARRIFKLREIPWEFPDDAK